MDAQKWSTACEVGACSAWLATVDDWITNRFNLGIPGGEVAFTNSLLRKCL